MNRGSPHRGRAFVMVLLAGCTGPASAEDRDLGPPARNPLDAVSTESLSAFRTRPLFAPTRAEAPPTSVTSPAQGEPEPPALKLVGIIEGRTRLAVVRIGDAAKARMVASGDMLDRWRVTVLDTGLRLTLGDRTVEIALFAAAGGRTPLSEPGAASPETPTLPPPE